MTELHKIEEIERTIYQKVKVFHSINSLVKYLKEEYCPSENKKIIEPFREYNTIEKFIYAQLKQEEQKFFKRVPPLSVVPIHEDPSIVQVKIPFNDYNNEDRWTGSSVEKFFVDRFECMVNL
jgi:hypothetical protein